MQELLVTAEVFPGARRECVLKVGEHMYRVFVREPAASQMATKRVVQIIALEYGVIGSCAQVIRGHASRKKSIRVIL